VAGQLRATSTLFYPTIASMYLEVAFALGLWLLLEPSLRRPRLERSLVFAALVVIGAGISATFTRAGLIGLFGALILVAAVRIRRLARTRWDLRPVVALGVLLVMVVALMHSPDRLAVRLGTEGSQAWYGAQYHVPRTLRLNAGATHSIPVAITNTGRLTWDSAALPPFTMSYHWLRGGSDDVIEFDGERTPFPFPVRPGQTAKFPVTVVAPGEAGSYTLVWDVAHETRAWLSTESVVTGATSSAVVTRMSRLPGAPIRPSRPQLWRNAFRMATARPWLGFGPDNFRHVYGRYAGLKQWDTRVHANNMYLEVLAGSGLVGLCALLSLTTASGLVLWQRVRHASDSALAASAAALAAWLVIAGHGLVDSFLSFTTTYLTFAMAMGLAFSPGLSRIASRDADCV
jgi:O-antigen ligase